MGKTKQNSNNENRNINTYKKLLLPNFILDCIFAVFFLITMTMVGIIVSFYQQRMILPQPVGITTAVFGSLAGGCWWAAIVLQIIMSVKLHKISSIKNQKLQFFTHLLCPIIGFSINVVCQIIMIILASMKIPFSTEVSLFFVIFLTCILIALSVWNACISMISKQQLKNNKSIKNLKDK